MFNCRDQSKLKLPESIHLLMIIIDSPLILANISEQKDKIVAIIIIAHDKKFNFCFERLFWRKTHNKKLKNGRNTETKNNLNPLIY